MANEKRLIDADVSLNDMCKRCNIENEGCPCEPSDCFVYNVLENSNTVDAVEVVRCKDCIHWYEPEETCLKIYSDGAVSAYAWQFRKPDDFCSYGERKDNG